MKYLLKALYTLIYTIAFPIILLRFWWRNITDNTGRRKAGPRRRFFERFGLCPRPKTSGGIVFHMVSVGEALGAINLVKQFQSAHPEVPITVTCTTQQGSKIIQEKLGETIHHCYLPYDLPVFLYLFFKRIQPKTFIILETELWPNLIGACYANNISTLLFNARLSEKSYRGYAKLGPLVESMLNQLTHLSCQSPADAQRFEQLGLQKKKLSINGNLKFDIQVDSQLETTGNALKSSLFADRPTWIAASTHPGEDEILLQSHKALQAQFPDLLLVLAPRHIDRATHVFKLTEAAGLSCTIHSKTGHSKTGPSQNSPSQNSPPETQAVLASDPAEQVNTAVYLVDTMGELMKFFACSDICFVGGSLVPHGGHNPIEPGVLRKPIIAGPYNHNFQTIYDQLEASNAVVFAKSASELSDIVADLLKHPDKIHVLAENAFQYVNAHRGATERSLSLIELNHRKSQNI